MKIVPFLAYRLLRGTQKEKNLSKMVQFCLLGITIGTCALILVLAIAYGFEKATYAKLKGVHADGIIRAEGKALNFKKIEEIIKKEFSTSIRAISPSDTYAVLTQDSSYRIGPVAYLKGVDPASLAAVTTFPSLITDTAAESSFAELCTNNGIIIGAKIAQHLDIKVGDELRLLYPESFENDSSQVALASHIVLIKAICTTGIEEIDEQLLLCSLDYLRDIFPQSAITEIGFAYQEKSDSLAVLKNLKKRFHELEVVSWQDLYPPLVAALTLEKYAVTCMVSLIILVASLNMVALLLMYIHQKRRVFAICIAMGMSLRSVQCTLVCMGLFISLLGSLAGAFLAFCLGNYLKYYSSIQLPDAYYVSTLPIELCWEFFFCTISAGIILGFLASLLPASTLSHASLSALLKSDD